MNFSLPGTLPAFQCRSCFTDLTQSPKEPNHLPDDHIISVVETAYRSALLGIPSQPNLLDNATDRAFRRFIEDMLQVLLVILSSRAEWPGSPGPLLLPRRSLLMIIPNWCGPLLQSETQDTATPAIGAVLCCGLPCSRLCPNIRGKNWSATASFGLCCFAGASPVRLRIAADSADPTIRIRPR